MAGISVSQLKQACADPAWFQRWLADPSTPVPQPLTPAGAIPTHGRLFHHLVAAFTTWLTKPDHLTLSTGIKTRDQLWATLWTQSARAALLSAATTQSGESALRLAEALKCWCRNLAALRAGHPGFLSWRSILLTHEFDFKEIPLPVKNHEPVLVSGRPDAVRANPPHGIGVVDYKLSRGTNSQADLLQLVIYARLLSIAKPGLLFAGILEYYDPSLRQQSHTAAELNDLFDQTVQPVLEKIAANPVVQGHNPSGPKIPREPKGRNPTNPDSPAPDGPFPVPRPDNIPAPAPRPWEPTSEPDLTQALVRAYATFKIPVTVTDRLEAPQLIRYHLKPGPGIPFQKLQRHAVDLQIALSLPLKPLVESGPGHVIFDVVKENPDTIYWRDAILRPEIARHPGHLVIPLGINIKNELILADLSDSNTAHALIGGSSGSGKSELLKAIVATLVRRNTPATLQLSLIDPKLLTFGGIPDNKFLAGPVLRDIHQSLVCLTEAVEDMERRYETLLAGNFTRLGDRIAAGLTGIPFHVIIFDEFADLIHSGKEEKKEFERLTSRLSTKGRAAGVHLIIATQRPDRDIVTGQLKANLPLKICLRVTNAINSQILLDEPGAELLLGRGDLLCQSASTPERGQSLFIPQPEFLNLFS